MENKAEYYSGDTVPAEEAFFLAFLTRRAKRGVSGSLRQSALRAPNKKEPLDQKAILNRIQGLMKRDGFGALVIVKPENVLYSTGYYSKFAYAPGVPAGSQAVVVIPAKGEPHLFINLMESDDAPRQTTGVEVSAMPGFVFVDDGTPESRQERSAHLLTAGRIPLFEEVEIEVRAQWTTNQRA